MISLLALLLAVVNSPNPSVTYACDGVTAAYTVSFPYLAYTDLLVTSTTAPGAITTLTYTTDYTVNLASTSSTASLTLNSPSTKCPVGNTLKIYRAPAITQPTSFKTQTTFNPALHEQAYDRIVMQIQEVKADDRSYADSVFAAGLTSSPMTWAATGTGAATVFALSGATATDSQVYQVTIDGVMQRPTTDYSVNSVAQQITFVAAPALNANIMVRSLTYVQALQLPLYKCTGTGCIARPMTAKLGEFTSITDYAQCDGQTDDRAAIQQAINNTAPGGTLWLPNDNACLVCSGLPLVISKSITIRGQNGNPAPGSQNAQLMACTGLGATTDVILVQPTSNQVISTRFYDMAINGQSGTPGRYGIRFDGTNGQINQVILDNVFMGRFGSQFAIRGEGASLGAGTPAITEINRSYFDSGGISCGMCGDLIKIQGTTFTGAGYALDLQQFVAGALMMILDKNYILSDKGIHVGTTTGAIQLTLTKNEFQPNVTFIGSNNAFIDLDGSAGSHIIDTVIEDNACLMSGFAFDCIRINYADRTYLRGNSFRRGTGGVHDVVVTANATETTFGDNDWVTGLPYSSMVGDSGTRTSFLSMVPGVNFRVAPINKPVIGAFDDVGTPRGLLSLSAAGEVQVAAYHTANSSLISSAGATWLYDNNGNLGLSVGSAASTAPTANAVASVQGLAVNGGVSPDRGGFKHKRAVAGCATAASIGAVCSTTFSWGTAAADANYTLLGCVGNGITSGAPIVQGITAKSASSVTVQTIALTAVAAQFTNIECSLAHD